MKKRTREEKMFDRWFSQTSAREAFDYLGFKFESDSIVDLVLSSVSGEQMLAMLYSKKADRAYHDYLLDTFCKTYISKLQ